MTAIRLLLAAAALLAAGLAAAGPAPAPRPPNILLAIADDWSYGHAGAYGCRWVKTPAFDRVAREGILFRRFYTPNAKCAPSRACLLTGRTSWQLEEAANHYCYFPARFRGYPEVLAEHGYHVGFTGKGWGPGTAQDAQGRPRQLTGRPYQARKLEPDTTGIASNDYAGNFEEFLQTAPAGRPWCFWYGSLEPHRGFEYGSGAARGGKKLSDVDRVPGYWPDNDTVRTDMLDYAHEVEHFDRHLGRMLALLERTGQLENTWIVVTSDHGMPFPRVKGQAYPFANRIPLAMMWKAGIRRPGRSAEDWVSMRDLAPTFLEAAGVEPARAGMAPVTGRSLAPLLRGDRMTGWPDHAVVGKERHDVGRPRDEGYPIRGWLDQDLLYLRNYEPDRWPAGNPETGYLNCDGGATKTDVLKARVRPGERRLWQLCFGKRPAEELYDVRRDPDCLRNLAADPAWRLRKERAARRLVEELRADGDPRIVGDGRVFDRYLYADPRNRGFYERFMAGEKLTAGWVSPTDFEPVPLDGEGNPLPGRP